MHLWRLTVAIQKSATHVYLIFDKPDHLPPPRSIVHRSRGKRNQHDTPDPVVTDAAAIPHSKSYSSLLANSTTFKRCLLQYVTDLFRDKSTAVTSNYSFSVTIDSPSLPAVNNGSIDSKPANHHGEADYAIWHHCIQEASTNILVVSSDTDTWVYGLGLYELGYLDGKNVTVQRGNAESFIDIRSATSLISRHPTFLSQY